MAAHRFEEVHGMLFEISTPTIIFLELWNLIVRRVWFAITSKGYGGFHSMVAVESFSYLIRSLMPEWVRAVAGCSATLAGCLEAKRLSVLTGVTLQKVRRTPVKGLDQ